MKKEIIKKRIISTIACAIVSVLVFCYICVVLLPKSESDMFASRVFQGSGYKNEPENSLDIMFFGNSDAYAGIIPAKIYGECGYTSYVCGKPLQTIEGVNAQLKNALETQSPKIVVLETDCLYEERSITINESNLFVSPFLFHSRWKELKRKDFTTMSVQNGTKDISKGYNMDTAVFKCTNTDYMGNSSDQEKPFSKKTMLHLQNFIDICQDNSIQVVFVELPSPCSWSYSRHNYIKGVADEMKIPFIDLNVPTDKYSVDFSKDFRDNGDHLNHNGAVKSTEYIQNFIKENYSGILSDKRNSTEFLQWNETAREYIPSNI